ncbi:hypothetical protein [Candidatus Thiodubiliella endoseptemdiera]|uniref:Uncharacterized protein n=1 Tax=Candidatus Thiodubiliella endoseptemdiera TaxID=2738886 RepID=A0A853F071_9GAMM|nr:hypothetical protein [Candidatus Thiodubiliella endoseptemdiera]
MIQATMADMRKSVDFFQTDQVISIINGRKKQEIGYFVPNTLKTDFLKFLNELEKSKRLKNAKRAAEAQMLDPIGDGSAGDGIE